MFEFETMGCKISLRGWTVPAYLMFTPSSWSVDRIWFGGRILGSNFSYISVYCREDGAPFVAIMLLVNGLNWNLDSTKFTSCTSHTVAVSIMDWNHIAKLKFRLKARQACFSKMFVKELKILIFLIFFLCFYIVLMCYIILMYFWMKSI
jgi:hypothetical protein